MALPILLATAIIVLALRPDIIEVHETIPQAIVLRSAVVRILQVVVVIAIRVDNNMLLMLSHNQIQGTVVAVNNRKVIIALVVVVTSIKMVF